MVYEDKNVTYDLYVLGQSESKELVGIGEEIRIDLSLEENQSLEAGAVYGKVTDEEGNPIPSALVKIFDESFNPIAHAYTDDNGNYVFSPFPPGMQYNISAIANGYILSDLTPFSLQSQQQLEINITLASDSKKELSVIAGDVLDYDNNPIASCSVKLFKILDNKEEIIATTTTNQYGQFLFADIPQGQYKIMCSKLGYTNDTTNIKIDRPSMIAKTVIKLNINPNAYTGTISGVIKDKNNAPIRNAIVTLYKVEEDGKLTPIKFTRTNNNGMYLFTNVTPGLTYKIKANKTIE